MQPLEKLQPKVGLSRPLQPIPKNSVPNQLEDPKEDSRDNITTKNIRLTKELFNIRKKMGKTNIKILIPSDREEYYRLGEEKSLCNVFNIQSFEQPINLLF